MTTNPIAATSPEFTQAHFVEASTLCGHDRTLVSYSTMATFRNCRRKYYWRQIAGIEPVAWQNERALYFGDVFHKALEAWHTGSDIKPLEIIERHYSLGSVPDGVVRADWARTMAMMMAYAIAYPREREDFEVVALEQEFRAEIRNPATGACSKSFVLGGKADGIIRRADGLWLLEHKTASEASVNRDYIDKLALDFQVQLYATEISRLLDEPIQGVLYNVICKPGIKPLEANKQRKVAESEDEYYLRCRAWMAGDDPSAARMLRIPLYVDAGQQSILEEEMWEITQQLLFAQRRSYYYQNPTQCFVYGVTCPYFALCTSKGNPVILENHYRPRAEAHPELTGAALGKFDATPAPTPAAGPECAGPPAGAKKEPKNKKGEGTDINSTFDFAHEPAQQPAQERTTTYDRNVF